MTQPEKDPYVYLGNQGPTREQIERDYGLTHGVEIPMERRVASEDPLKTARAEIERQQKTFEEQLGVKLTPRLADLIFSETFAVQAQHERGEQVFWGQRLEFKDFLKAIVFLPQESDFKEKPWVLADYYTQRVRLQLSRPDPLDYFSYGFSLYPGRSQNDFEIELSNRQSYHWGRTEGKEGVLLVKFGKYESDHNLSRCAVCQLPLGWEEELFDKDGRYKEESKASVTIPQESLAEPLTARKSDREAVNLNLARETIKETNTQLGKDLGADLVPCQIKDVEYSGSFIANFRRIQDRREHFRDKDQRPFDPEEILRVIPCLPRGTDISNLRLVVGNRPPGTLSPRPNDCFISIYPFGRVSFSYGDFPTPNEVNIYNALGNCGSWGRGFDSEEVMFVGFTREKGTILCRTIYNCNWRRLFREDGSLIEEAPIVTSEKRAIPQKPQEVLPVKPGLRQEAQQILGKWGSGEGFNLIKSFLQERTEKRAVLTGQPQVGETVINDKKFDLYVESIKEANIRLRLARAKLSLDHNLQVPIEQSNEVGVRRDLVWNLSLHTTTHYHKDEEEVRANCWSEEVGTKGKQKSELRGEEAISLTQAEVLAVVISGLSPLVSPVHTGESRSGSAFTRETAEQMREYERERGKREREAAATGNTSQEIIRQVRLSTPENKQLTNPYTTANERKAARAKQRAVGARGKKELRAKKKAERRQTRKGNK